MVEKIAQRLLDKRTKATFNANWFVVVVKKTGNRSHRNFTIKLGGHLLLYKGVNLGYGTQIQREARAKGVVRMKAKGHVVVRVQ